MKRVLVWCCVTVCLATVSIFGRNSSQQTAPLISNVVSDTVPHAQDTMNKTYSNKSYRKDSGYNNKYNSNRNMNVDTGSSNRNNMNNPPTRDSLSNKPPQQ
ncbi:MAG TPA: hypothetical protein VEV83_12030 [Parafilimonas sp.]|nr:hypothetical protein [Parafilimonas sp.]